MSRVDGELFDKVEDQLLKGHNVREGGQTSGNANIDATAKKSADAAGPTVPPTTEGYIASEVGPSPAQAESWRSH